MDEDERQAKKEKTVDDDDDDGEEMEIEEDEEPGAKGKNGGMPYSLKVSHGIDVRCFLRRRRHTSGGPPTIKPLAMYKSPTRGHGRRTLSIVPAVRDATSLYA